MVTEIPNPPPRGADETRKIAESKSRRPVYLHLRSYEGLSDLEIDDQLDARAEWVEYMKEDE